jgi:hypothetical protein
MLHLLIQELAAAQPSAVKLVIRLQPLLPPSTCLDFTFTSRPETRPPHPRSLLHHFAIPAPCLFPISVETCPATIGTRFADATVVGDGLAFSRNGLGEERLFASGGRRLCSHGVPENGKRWFRRAVIVSIDICASRTA